MSLKEVGYTDVTITGAVCSDHKEEEMAVFVKFIDDDGVTGEKMYNLNHTVRNGGKHDGLSNSEATVSDLRGFCGAKCVDMEVYDLLTNIDTLIKGSKAQAVTKMSKQKKDEKGNPKKDEEGNVIEAHIEVAFLNAPKLQSSDSSMKSRMGFLFGAGSTPAGNAPDDKF